MKIIDKNSKLFGKINIMDLMIIMTIIIIGIFAFNKLSNRGGNITASNSSKIEIYFVAEAYGQLPNIAESIVVGDRLVAQNKYQLGTIDYVKIRDDDYISTTKDGTFIAEKNPLKKTIEVGIKGEANINGPYIEIGGQEIKVGLPYWIKTSKGQIKGFIKEIRLKQ